MSGLNSRTIISRKHIWLRKGCFGMRSKLLGFSFLRNYPQNAIQIGSVLRREGRVRSGMKALNNPLALILVVSTPVGRVIPLLTTATGKAISGFTFHEFFDIHNDNVLNPQKHEHRCNIIELE